MGQPVALKLTTPSPASEQMLVEARALAHMRSGRHPNVVQVYEAARGRIAGGSVQVDVDYIVMEFVEGRTLRTFVSENVVEPATMLSLFASIASALEFVHAYGIVHGDVKPDNILVRPDGSPVLVDFAFANSVVGARGGVQSPVVLGTPPYIAPEAMQGRVRRRGDVYSLAMVFWEAWTGAVPFEGPSAPQSMFGRVLALPAEETVPRRLRELVKRSLRTRPGARPHAAHLAEAFDRAARDAAPRAFRARHIALLIVSLSIIGLVEYPVTRQAGQRMIRTRMVSPATFSIRVHDANAECAPLWPDPISLSVEPAGRSRMQGWFGGHGVQNRIRLDWAGGGTTTSTVFTSLQRGKLVLRWNAFRAIRGELTVRRDGGAPLRCAVVTSYADDSGISP